MITERNIHSGAAFAMWQMSDWDMLNFDLEIHSPNTINKKSLQNQHHAQSVSTNTLFTRLVNQRGMDKTLCGGLINIFYKMVKDEMVLHHYIEQMCGMFYLRGNERTQYNW